MIQGHRFALNALLVGAIGLGVTQHARAIDIVVNYDYDTNNFFDTQAKQDAMQAVADRFSRVINSSLLAVGPGGTAETPAGWRVGFTHPGTGASFQLSTADSSASDPILGAGGPAADAYGFAGLNTDEWILYAGGRSQANAGLGGTGTGTNFTSTFDDELGPLHRGLIPNTPAASSADLPVWGGSISFDTAETWHFDTSTLAGPNTVDFYSIALHEVGHALGLSSGWNQWQTDGDGNYVGPAAIAAYNADNDPDLAELGLVDPNDNHWAEDAYDSFIFEHGQPNTIGTVPDGTKQDLLMEPLQDFGGLQDRFELTNVDVAALEDLGWSVIPEPATAGLLVVGGIACLTRRR